jgi:RNA polymerase sigma factor (sigma-70 family)
VTSVAHDTRGFERMYRRHVPAVYRYVLAVLGNQADAEDATQQTFLSAYRAWEQGERPRRAHNWLITIAHNVCRQRFRERSRRPAEVELEAEAVPAAVDERLEAADLMTALGQLQFNQRTALVMRELEGRSYDEIAGTLGVSHSAVETLLFRARRSLREQLEGELTCSEAERALSRRLDGELPRAEAAALRAHVRACSDCATLERRMRARRAALRGLAFPLPSSLGSFGGGASTAATGGLLAKGAAVLAVGALAAGVATHGLDRARPHTRTAALPAVPAAVAPATAVARPHTTERHAAVRHARRVARPAPKKPAAHAAPTARPVPRTTTLPTTTTPTTTAAAQPVAATISVPALPAVEVDWHRLARLGRGPVIELPALVGTLPAPPAIAAAIEEATPAVSLPAAATVTVPLVTTVTVPVPPGP